MLLISLPAHFVGAATLIWLANQAGSVSWRRAVSAHWTERARLLWPARFTAAISVFLIPVLLFLLQLAVWPGTTGWWIPNGLAAFAGALLGCYPFDRAIFPQLSFRLWRNQVLAGWGLRIGILGSLLAACLLMPEHFGYGTLLVASGYLAFHFAMQWGLLLAYLKWVRHLRPAENRLKQIVDGTATNHSIKVRATWQLGGPMALAFAFPTTGDVVFSDRLLEICNDQEIAAICAHEIAHLTESKVILAGRLAGSLVLFPLIFIVPLAHSLGVTAMLLPYAAMFIILQFALRLSQRMEKRADQLAVTEQADQGVYARALEKLYRENQIPVVNVNNRQTHPHLYDRLLAAGLTPDYPRPAKPRRFTWIGWVYLGIFVATAMITLLRN